MSRQADLWVRRLGVGDAQIFREIRLECLRLYPGAFGSTYNDWCDQPLSYFEARLKSATIIGLFDENGLQGLLAYSPEQGGNSTHRAQINAVYIRQDCRGRHGLDAMMDHVVGLAREQQVIQLELTVSEENTPAIAAYRRLGFARVAVLPRALRTPAGFVDEILMIRRLDQGGAGGAAPSA